MHNTVLHYLEETAEKHPDKTAITDERGSVTFRELRDRALSVAAAVSAATGGESHAPVFVYLPKSVECIVSFFGVVYSGNIYTPADVRFPFPKIQGIIDVLQPALYISDRKNAKKLTDNGINGGDILLVEDIPGASGGFDVRAALGDMLDTDPVYTFFTSGSTGVPKGVTITHRSIRDYIDWAAECFGIDGSHVIGNQAPLYFDNSILDIYSCAKTGAHLHLIPESIFSFPVRLMQYLEDNRISLIFWVPSALCLIANSDALEYAELSHLRKVLFCGEVMPNKQLNYWRRHLPGAMYANLYGPTEITDVCTYYIVDRQFSDEEPLPIGRPCANTGVILLDEDGGRVAGTGVLGELCVRGSSLSPGYWGAFEKTAEVFVQNPLNCRYPEKIYRTGDLAYYNDRMELMFAGRKDFQIKHMGYRIELGEIEAAAMAAEGVETASADYDAHSQQIVLFYSGQGAGEEALQKTLKGCLPKYMLPSRYVMLDRFPLSDNGKIDRKRLRSEHM